MSKKFSTRDLALIAQGAALLVVCSWLNIPAAVPFTMQSFACFLLGALLGRKRGVLAVLLYLLLGAFGLPVFSGFRSGIGALLGPTGGYLLGFLLLPLCVGFASDRYEGRPLPLALGMFFGIFLCYACGTAWFVVVYTHSKGEIALMRVLHLCVLPFLLPDALKAVLALALARRLLPIVRK